MDAHVIDVHPVPERCELTQSSPPLRLPTGVTAQQLTGSTRTRSHAQKPLRTFSVRARRCDSSSRAPQGKEPVQVVLALFPPPFPSWRENSQNGSNVGYRGRWSRFYKLWGSTFPKVVMTR